jgi:hypothetical protein
MSHTRDHVGNQKYVHVVTGNGLGKNSHFREGPPKPEDVFKPLPVCLPENAWRNPHYDGCEIEPDTDPVVSQVPESEITVAFLAFVLFTVAWVRKFN